MKFLTLGLCLCVLSFAGRANAATITVNAGGDLQGAINAAKPGDTIVLQAGAVFTGNYELPVKGGTSYITIRSSAPDSSLPPDGTRIAPAYSASLAKVRSDQFGTAFRTVGPASYWRLMFLELLPSNSTSAANLLELGATGAVQNTLAAVPHHLIVDRCYLHGDPSYGQRRGIALNSGETQIINSYISDIKGMADTQAIAGWNGPGPYLIENNYLEASAENVLFGGGDPSIPNLVPSNITIRRNLIAKPIAWMTASWTIKNLLEFKNADTVTIEGNTIENNWAAGQQGYAIVFTPRNQDGTAPWTVVQNITVRNNVIRHLAAVFNIFGYDNDATSRQTNNIVVSNNLIYDVSTAYSTPANAANGWFAIIGNQPRDIKFDHNTIDNDGNDTFFFYEGTPPAGTPIYGVVLTSNLLRDNLYGIFGNSSQEGSVSLATYAPGAYVQGNGIGGGDPTRYPVGNEYPTLTQWFTDFVNRPAANYQLAPTSLSKGAGADGKDIGVDFTALNAAMNGTATQPPPPPPAPPGASTPFTGAPIALPGRIEAENYDKGGEGIAYHDTTAGNSAGAYRNDDVDIRSTTDTSGAYNVKSVRAGEWLAYTVNVAAAGTYSIDFRVASSGTGGTVHVTVDGVDLTGAIALLDTGGWSVWKTFSKSGVTLPAGTHVLKLIVDANGSGGTVADINWINVSATAAPPPPPAPTSTPYTGTAVAVPGRIETENYDRGGEGLAYHDATAGNSTGAYRTDDVDIRSTTDVGGGYNIKSVRAGEWLAYSVKVPTAGTYSIDVRAASLGGGGTIHFTVDGVDVTGPIALPDTGGWNTWQTTTRAGMILPAGAHVIKLVVDANASAGTVADLNWFAVR
ncbi:MAG TPA: carbohydrate-binding protein [Vicinamibacterales bacterium]|nr:carbohydrate-binding protein [Vicinamibacterales bacterium]